MTYADKSEGTSDMKLVANPETTLSVQKNSQEVQLSPPCTEGPAPRKQARGKLVQSSSRPPRSSDRSMGGTAHHCKSSDLWGAVEATQPEVASDKEQMAPLSTYQDAGTGGVLNRF